MVAPSARLAALGLTLPDAPTPVGSYVPALPSGDLIYTSGQLPFEGGELAATGIVGNRASDLSPERAAECARIAVLNAIAAAAQVAGGIDAITGVLRLTGYVAAAPDFTGHPAVLNSGSGLLADVFGDSGRHVRSVVGVASLPLGSPVEVELIVTTAS